MDIRINGQQIDITLETEKNLEDIEKSMSDWAAKRDLILTGLFADDIFYMAGEVPGKPIDDVEIVDLQIQSRVELIINTLTDGISYCNRITDYIDHAIEEASFDERDIEPFFKGIDWLLDITQSSFKQIDLDVHSVKHLDKTVAEYLGDIISIGKELKTLVAEQNQEKVIAYLTEQKNLFAAFRGIFKLALMSDNIKQMVIKSIDSPDSLIQSLYDSREKLPEQLENLEAISEAFQSGKDREASERLHGFLDFMHLFSRSAIQSAPVFSLDPATITVDGVSFDDKIAEINDLLSELLTALENDDIITVSDLLEYELKPSLEPVPEFITIILDTVSSD
jgi:hypothetical protein